MHIVDVWIRCVCSHMFSTTAFGVWDCPKCGKVYKVEGSKITPRVSEVKGSK